MLISPSFERADGRFGRSFYSHEHGYGTVESWRNPVRLAIVVLHMQDEADIGMVAVLDHEPEALLADDKAESAVENALSVSLETFGMSIQEAKESGQ